MSAPPIPAGSSATSVPPSSGGSASFVPPTPGGGGGGSGPNTNPRVPCGAGVKGATACTPNAWKWRQGLILFFLSVSTLISLIVGLVATAESSKGGGDMAARGVFVLVALAAALMGMTSIGIQLQPLASGQRGGLLVSL